MSKLNKPIVTANGTIISFDDITNATSYEVFANGVSIGQYVVPIPEPLVEKGQIINMNLDGTSRSYRVMKVNGSIVEVFGNFSVASSKFKTKASSITTYQNSNIKIQLDNWYNNLSQNIKDAIIPQTKKFYKYSYSRSAKTDSHASYYNYSSKTESGAEITCNVYTLGVEDIEEYFNGTFSSNDLKLLAFNTTSTIVSDYLFWMSSLGDSSDLVWVSSSGYIDVNSSGTETHGVKPMLTIDLSKVEWS